MECWQRQREGAPPPLAFVFATIRRRAIDLARSKERRTQREQTASDSSPAAWFEPNVEDRERSRVIQTAMQHLPDIYREVITLKLADNKR